MYTDWLFRALLQLSGELWEAKGTVCFGWGRTLDIAALCTVFEELKKRTDWEREGKVLAVSVLPIIGVEPLFQASPEGHKWEIRIKVKRRSSLLTIGDWLKEDE